MSVDFLRQEYYVMAEMFKTYWNGRLTVLVVCLTVIGYSFKEVFDSKNLANSTLIFICQASIIIVIAIMVRILSTLSKGIYMFIYRMEEIAGYHEIIDFWSILPNYFQKRKSDAATFMFYIISHVVNLISSVVIVWHTFQNILAQPPFSLEQIGYLSFLLANVCVMTLNVVVTERGLRSDRYYLTPDKRKNIETEKAESVKNYLSFLYYKWVIGILDQEPMKQAWFSSVNKIREIRDQHNQSTGFIEDFGGRFNFAGMKTPSAEEGGFIPTLNKQGWMLQEPDRIMKKFIDYAAQKPGHICVDIGAAYGVATKLALQKGAKIIANDIDSRHLDVIINETPSSSRERLATLEGSFPYKISFENGSIGAFLIARVLHFLSRKELEDGAQYLYNWLMPGGRIFITAETPYLGFLQKFKPVYEKRMEDPNTRVYAGEINDITSYTERGENLPERMMLMNKETLAFIFERVGFQTVENETFARGNFPKDIQLDGRESIGYIAYKPLE